MLKQAAMAHDTSMDGYSLENAVKFQWSSVSGELNSERIEHLEKYLTGNKILDAGCGGGGFVDFLTQKGFDVTGLDKYPEFLQVATEKGFQGRFVQGDVTRLPFPDKYFDCAYCFDVLEHVDDKLALAELVRVTKNRIIVAVPREDDGLFRHGLTLLPYMDMTHLRYYTETSLKSLMQEAKPRSVVVFPEQQVDVAYLLKSLLDKTLQDSVYTTDAKSVKKMIQLLLLPLANLKPLRSMYLGWLFDNNSYRKIYLALLGVIDL